MGKPWQFEIFEPPPSFGFALSFASEEELEEIRLAAFDKGYRSGWDDSAVAHAEEQATIRAELSQNLQELDFTYLEARGAVLREVETLLRGMVDKVFAGDAQAALRALVVEEALAAAKQNSDRKFEIVVNPVNGPTLQGMLQEANALSASVLAEESLGEGQAFLRLGGSEQKIDIDALLERLSGSISEFFDGAETPEEGRLHA